MNIKIWKCVIVVIAVFIFSQSGQANEKKSLSKQEYVSKLKELKKKAENHLTARTIIEILGWKDLKAVKGDNQFMEYQIVKVKDAGNPLYLGSVWQLNNRGQRASPQFIQSTMNKAVAMTLDYCNKTAVKKHHPFFTANNIEVYSISFLCDQSKEGVTHRRMMALQNEEKIMNIYIAIPSDNPKLFGQELFKKIAEAISKKIF